MYTVLLAWTFPPQRTKHRAIDSAHSMLVFLSAAVSLTLLACHKENETALKVSRGLDRKLQSHILGEEFHPEAPGEFFRELLRWLRRPPREASDERGLQYALFTSSEH